MTQNTSSPTQDLIGAGRLTIDAIVGITDLVEALHQTISSLGGIFSEPYQNRTSGITGMVYRNIRMVTQLTGTSMDILFGRLNNILGEKESSPQRDAVLSALNGVLGDYLADTGNPLAIPMQFRRKGLPLPLDDPELAESISQSQGKIVLMVHGCCMNDLQWNWKGHDHGAFLANDLGYLPIYLHYNSGRHVSENGKEFASLLEAFVNHIDQPLELMILAHSMGGLISRSACHYGISNGHIWVKHLQKLIFMATPHHGAPLERCGNWIDTILQISPYSAPFSRLGKIRSSGITDLRYGNVLDEDWQGRDRFEHSKDHRIPVPLPKDIKCYAIAATTAKESNMIGDGLIGDGLVTLKSALGQHKHANLNLEFPETHQWIGRNMNHMDLLHHPQVYETIKQWLKA